MLLRTTARLGSASGLLPLNRANSSHQVPFLLAVEAATARRGDHLQWNTHPESPGGGFLQPRPTEKRSPRKRPSPGGDGGPPLLDPRAATPVGTPLRLAATSMAPS